MVNCGPWQRQSLSAGPLRHAAASPPVMEICHWLQIDCPIIQSATSIWWDQLDSRLKNSKNGITSCGNTEYGCERNIGGEEVFNRVLVPFSNRWLPCLQLIIWDSETYFLMVVLMFWHSAQCGSRWFINRSNTKSEKSSCMKQAPERGGKMER